MLDNPVSGIGDWKYFIVTWTECHGMKVPELHSQFHSTTGRCRAWNDERHPALTANGVFLINTAIHGFNTSNGVFEIHRHGLRMILKRFPKSISWSVGLRSPGTVVNSQGQRYSGKTDEDPAGT